MGKKSKDGHGDCQLIFGCPIFVCVMEEKSKDGYGDWQLIIGCPIFLYIFYKIPWINLRGFWLEQAGFEIGTPYTIEVYDKKLVFTAV